MLRRLLLLLPAVAVAIVLWAVLTAGWPHPVDVAQVRGGPPRGALGLSWLVSVQHLEGGRRSPSPDRPLRLSLRAGSLHASASGTSDREGLAELRIDLARPLDGDPWLRVEAADTGALLAEGTLTLSGENWRSRARRQGGWVPGRQQGELRLRVALAEGTLAVPFEAELVIEAMRGPAAGGPNGLLSASQPAAGVQLTLALTGAERTTAAEPLLTDDRGLARVALRPLEHAILLELRAFAAGQPAGAALTPLGEWYGALPVTPGALHAALDGQRLLVRSPIPRDTAYVSLVDPERRRAGYIVALEPDAEGGASGSVELPAEVLPRVAADAPYAVVSSEPDKRSSSAVGWPLRAARASVPALSFDVADQLLLDGTQGVLEQELAGRLGRRRLASLLLALVGLGMAGAFAAEVLGCRHPEAPAGAELALSSQRWWLVLALSCLLLGLGALTYFGLLQR